MPKKTELPVEPEFYAWLDEMGLIDYASELVAGDKQTETLARINERWRNR